MAKGTVHDQKPRAIDHGPLTFFCGTILAAAEGMESEGISQMVMFEQMRAHRHPVDAAGVAYVTSFGWMVGDVHHTAGTALAAAKGEPELRTDQVS
jgi:hypothetical protein